MPLSLRLVAPRNGIAAARNPSNLALNQCPLLGVKRTWMNYGTREQIGQEEAMHAGHGLRPFHVRFWGYSGHHADMRRLTQSGHGRPIFAVMHNTVYYA
jgi:hypothetical protein